MPEIHDLDRAFASLTDDLAVRSGRPGAGAAIRTARSRRRTNLAALAAAIVVAAAGVAVPGLTGGLDRIGFAGGLPDAAPLDARALEEATEGWISGWTDDRSSGPFSKPDCDTTPDALPATVSSGRSFHTASQDSVAVAVLHRFGDAADLEQAWDAYGATLGACARFTTTGVPDYADGTQVQHVTVRTADEGAALTDIWVARTGTSLGVLETTTAAGAAPGEAVDAVSDALVAGLRSGWVQDSLGPAPAAQPALRPQLPAADDRALRAAMGDWRTAHRVDGSTLPTTPCLSVPRSGAGSASSGSPRGHYVSVVGQAHAGSAAREQVAAMLEALRRCDAIRVTERALPSGVVLLTYDRGGEAGHGAVWLASSADRAGVVAVDAVAEPVPDEVALRVGEFLRDTLGESWPDAS